MTKPTAHKNRTTNWKTYKAALMRRGSLMVWFDPVTRLFSYRGNGQQGRDATFSDAAIKVCLMIKALYGLPLRQSTGLVESLISMAGLGWAIPDHSTLCRRQETLTVAIPCRHRQVGLHLQIESTGVKTMDEGNWKFKRHWAVYRRLIHRDDSMLLDSQLFRRL